MTSFDVVRPRKAVLATLMARTGATAVLAASQRTLLRNRFIRVVNYHGTPSRLASSFERQLKWYAARFTPVGFPDLDAFLKTGEWSPPRPGLIITFDDGMRSNYDVARPLLEAYGFTGWFFLPSAWISNGEQDRALVARYSIEVDEVYEDGRTLMSVDEVRALAKRHVVGCHTKTHKRLGPGLSPEALHSEIVDARRELSAIVGHSVDTFCWVGGEETSYSSSAAKAIRDAGYRFSFMTNNAPIVATTSPLQLQRTNVEAAWALDVIAFQLSGAMDIVYSRKRGRVNRLTSGSQE